MGGLGCGTEPAQALQRAELEVHTEKELRGNRNGLASPGQCALSCADEFEPELFVGGGHGIEFEEAAEALRPADSLGSAGAADSIPAVSGQGRLGEAGRRSPVPGWFKKLPGGGTRQVRRISWREGARGIRQGPERGVKFERRSIEVIPRVGGLSYSESAKKGHSSAEDCDALPAMRGLGSQRRLARAPTPPMTLGSLTVPTAPFGW